VRELQLGRDFQSLSDMDLYLQRSMMLQHENVVSLKGTDWLERRLLHRSDFGCGGLSVRLPAAQSLR